MDSKLVGAVVSSHTTLTAPTLDMLHITDGDAAAAICRYCRIVAAEVLGRVSMEWGSRAAIEQAGAVDPLINLLRLNHSPGVCPLDPPAQHPIAWCLLPYCTVLSS